MTTTDYPSNEIGNLPGVASFGNAFSYAAWTPGTTVMLCNVPWNNDYRDIVHYESKAALNTYLDTAARTGPKITIDKMTHCRMGMPIRLNLPFAQAFKYNYIRVVNNAQPVTAHSNSGAHADVTETGAQTLYYFITDVRYLAPNTTEIFIQLDVWQTFCHDVTFGNCYIERGHVGIANANAFDNNGRDYLTIPEGLDVGNEYVISKTYEHVFVDNHDEATDIAVMVMSTTSLFGPYGTVDAPKLTMAQGSSYGGTPNGCDIYLFADRDDFRAYMLFMADKPWVTQGIVSVTAVSYAATISSTTVTESLSWVEGGPPFLRLISGGGDGDVLDITLPEFDATATIKDRRWLAQDWRDGLLPARYASLKKFLTFPYTAVELTTYSATPIVLKPECMPGDDIVVLQKAFMGQPNPRIVYIPYKYNADNDSPVVVNELGAIINDGGEMFDFMTGIFDLPTFSVVNDGYLQYMAANRNAIAFQHQSADWSQQRAIMGANASYGNANQSIGLGLEQSRIGVGGMYEGNNIAQDALAQRTLLGNAQALLGGGGVAGAARQVGGNIAESAIAANQMNKQTALNAGQNLKSAYASAGAGRAIADTNLAYAQSAAQGDYANAIASINARVQDAKLIQPTTAGQLGGDVFNLAMFKWGVFAKVKTLQPAVMAAIGEFWLRYGYSINRFGRMPEDFQVMTKFTYWKLRETYLASGACPETFRQTIRGIFEKGVTVWANADDIGMIDIADNNPRAGIEL